MSFLIFRSFGLFITKNSSVQMTQHLPIGICKAIFRKILKFWLASGNCHFWGEMMKNDNYDELPDFTNLFYTWFLKFPTKFFGMAIFGEITKIIYRMNSLIWEFITTKFISINDSSYDHYIEYVLLNSEKFKNFHFFRKIIKKILGMN